MDTSLRLEHISVSEHDNNCYLLCAGSSGLLIDAADDAPALLALADAAGVTIEAVLTTHRHFDHVRALEEVLAATGATHYASYLDAPALPAPADVELHHGDILSFAGIEFPIVILRGHTPGGAALIANIDGQTHAFVGDSLFPGGVGKTHSESDFVRLFTDVKERLFETLPPETIVHPGHGAGTTLAAEAPHLDEWWERRW